MNELNKNICTKKIRDVVTPKCSMCGQFVFLKQQALHKTNQVTIREERVTIMHGYSD